MQYSPDPHTSATRMRWVVESRGRAGGRYGRWELLVRSGRGARDVLHRCRHPEYTNTCANHMSYCMCRTMHKPRKQMQPLCPNVVYHMPEGREGGRKIRQSETNMMSKLVSPPGRLSQSKLKASMLRNDEAHTHPLRFVLEHNKLCWHHTHTFAHAYSR